MKKIVSLALSAMLATTAVAGLASCGDDDKGKAKLNLEPVAKSELKVGFILLHDENSTYDLNFINGVKRAQENLGLADSQIIMKKNIPEGKECYEAAADLVDQGCDVIFADSFGHEDFMIQAAEEFPEVRFCHATGTKAHTTNLPNIHNAFASIYEGRFLAGVAAGMKLVEMHSANKLEASNYTDTAKTTIKMGYVGAYPYAEVKSGYTSYYLGAKFATEGMSKGQLSVAMDVTFTNSWYDPTAEADGANLLIDRGAALISQHADSMGAPSTCETRKVPNVSYNGSTETACPETFIVSSYIDWAPYFEYMIDCTINGVKIAADWCGTLENGAVKLTEFGAKASPIMAQEKIEAIKTMLIAGEMQVFDCRNFTVKGAHITTYLADVHNRNFAHDTQAIVKGTTMEYDPTEEEMVEVDYYYFAESSLRSAPYFDIDIDGITLLTNS